jgi:hypothetical protein
MFATVGYDQRKLLSGVRSVTGEAPLSGCSGEGIITQDGPEGETIFTMSGPVHKSDAVAVMTIASDELHFANYMETGLKENSRNVGEVLGKKIAAGADPRPIVSWVMIDVFGTNVKEFLEGITATAPASLPCIGALSGDNFIRGDSFQYHNDTVLSDGAACVLISGDLKMEFGITHGCVPIGLEKTITRARGNTVFTIENWTAWDFFKQYLDEKWTKFTREIRTFLDFAVKLPADLATEYNHYIIRAPKSQNPDDSMDFFTEIPEGTKVQIIRRDPDKISQGAKALAERINARLGKRVPALVLHVECASRGRMFFGDDVKEKGIDVMQDALGKDVPWLGLFASGEVAPIRGVNYYHNQTAVLCVFYK